MKIPTRFASTKNIFQPHQRRALGALVVILSAIALIGSAAILIALVSIRLQQVTQFDDSFMYIRYAENFWDGYGAAWNRDGIRTHGTTSALYLAIIIVAQGIFRNAAGHAILTATSAMIGAAGIVLTAAACVRLSVSKSIRESWLFVSAFICLALMFSQTFLFHLTNGMDTMLSLTCNALLIWTAWSWAHQKKPAWKVAAAAYISFLARPDNIIYAASFPIFCAWFFHDGDRKKTIVRFIFSFAALLAVDTALKTALFGDPLPLPFYAKTSGYYEGYLHPEKWNPVTQLFTFGKMVLPFLVIAVFSFSPQRNGAKILAVFTPPVLATFLYYFTVLQIMGHEARYYVPSLPFFIIGSSLLFNNRLSQTSAPLARKGVRLLLAGALTFFVLTPAIQSWFMMEYEKRFIPRPRVYADSIPYSTPTGEQLPSLGWWESITIVADMAKALPNDTKFAMSEYGYVGSQALQVHIIDPLGLHDPFFAHHGFSIDEFFSRKPELIWFPHPDYSKINASILDSPEFWREYNYYPTAFDYGFAIRKGSADAVIEEVNKAWRKAYNELEMSAYLARVEK